MQKRTTSTVNVPQGLICDKKTLVMIDGDIHIEPDIFNGGDGNINGCIFVASGNISIGAGEWKTQDYSGYEAIKYDYMEAFMIAENKLDLELADVYYPNSTDRIYMRDGLEIHGGLVAFGSDLGPGESAVQVNRSLALFNNVLPTVVTSWDPRYAKLSEIFFGTGASLYKQEVGFKPY